MGRDRPKASLVKGIEYTIVCLQTLVFYEISSVRHLVLMKFRSAKSLSIVHR
jgi:hypothetical protein